MTASKWTRLVRQCLLRRMNGEELRDLADNLAEEGPVQSSRVVKSILNSRVTFCLPDDPLIPQYIRAVLLLGLIQVSDVLRILAQPWIEGIKDDAINVNVKADSIFLVSDSLIVHELTATLATYAPSITTAEAHAGLMLLSRWLVALAGWASQDVARLSNLSIMTLALATGDLLASLADSPAGLSKMYAEEELHLHASIKDALNACLPLMAGISAQLHARLEALQKRLDTALPSSARLLSTIAHRDALELDRSVLERPAVRAKASLFVYLNAALCGQNLLADDTLLGFLNSRYGSDSNAMFVDLIVAAFDAFAADGSRLQESEDSMTLYRTFLLGRLPPVLSLILATSTEQLSAEACITQALSHVASSIGRSYSASHGPSSLGVVPKYLRQDFVSACVLHRLISKTSAEGILGGALTQTILSHGLYVKDNLVQQMTNSSQRGDQLVAELLIMEGNSGAITFSLVEVMHNLARNKDTVHLKELCNSIIRRPRSLDVIMMFHSSRSVLAPLCLLLDEWKWDELQGESQPVYEEFGSILLLVLVAKHRYNIASADLGATTPASFVRRLIEQNAMEQPLGSFAEASSKHLGAWISALFVAEELSDEVTSACSPKEFYPLVPSLLSQSLEACQAGMLSLEKLTSGFEYLHASFLLPSLVIALLWLNQHLWERGGDHQIALHLVQALVKPPASSEAQEIHRTIIAIVAKPLKQQLGAIEVLRPSDPDLRALMTTLKTHEAIFRQTSVSEDEAKSWTLHGQTLLSTLRQKFRALVYWSNSTEVNNTRPPIFTYDQIVLALQLHGASMVLHKLIDELRSMYASLHFEPGVDVIATIVCATSTIHSTSACTLSLRESLELECTSFHPAHEKDDRQVEEVYARVHHRVEDLSIVISQQQQDMTMDTNAPIVPELSGLHLQNIDMNAAISNADVNGSAIGASAAQAEDIDKMLDAAVAATDDYGAGNMGGGMEDMFGLDSADLGMGNFDEMDLEAMF